MIWPIEAMTLSCKNVATGVSTTRWRTAGSQRPGCSHSDSCDQRLDADRDANIGTLPTVLFAVADFVCGAVQVMGLR